MSKTFYIFKDIFNHKRGFSLFLVQMIVAMFLMALSINQIVSMQSNIAEMEHYNLGGKFFVQDETPFEKVESISQSQNNDEFYRFYSSIPGNQYRAYAYFPYQDEYGYTVEERIINKEFFDLFYIPIEAGRGFIENDFLWEYGNAVPILIGCNLQKKYGLNETYTFYHGDNDAFEGTVIGIIEENASYPSFQVIGNEEVLNDSYIIPLNDTFVEEYFIFSDYDMAFSSTIFAPDDDGDLEKISALSTEYNLFTFNFVTTDNVFEQYISQILESFRAKATISSIILLFACAAMASLLYAIMQSCHKEYAVHLICGAKVSNIFIRIAAQLAIVTTLACVPCFIYLGFGVDMMYTLILITIITAIVLLPVLIHLRQSRIIHSIRASN